MSYAQDYYRHYGAHRDVDVYREVTGFLTNFRDEKLAQYQAAIEAYKLVDPSVVLVVQEGYGGHSGYSNGLYRLSKQTDLSAFWRLFETFKELEK